MSFERIHTNDGCTKTFVFDSEEDRALWDEQIAKILRMFDDIERAPKTDSMPFHERAMVWMSVVYDLADRLGKARIPPYLQQTVNVFEDMLYMDNTDWNDEEQRHDLPRLPTTEEVLKNSTKPRPDLGKYGSNSKR